MSGGWVGCGAYVSGGLVKSDFITHSGSHQSTAWIQNPSLSRVWQLYNQCKKYLEQNEKNWVKLKVERDLEIKRKERLFNARKKQDEER